MTKTGSITPRKYSKAAMPFIAEGLSDIDVFLLRDILFSKNEPAANAGIITNKTESRVANALINNQILLNNKKGYTQC